MENMITQDEKNMVLLDTLASEARLLTENIAMNMLQLGRVLTEAKALVGHGNFGTWVENNCDFSERYAQQFMSAYSRYGEKTGIERLGKSKILKLLALPAGTEDKFLEENNVDDMTAREVEAAVKRVRAEMQREIDKERALREMAEKKEIPDDVFESMRKKDEKIAGMTSEISRLSAIDKENIEEQNALRRENARLKAELDDQNALNEEQQESVKRAQAELLNLKSQIARGDAERNITTELTLAVFAGAVRNFVGTCARMPHMGRAFARMDNAEWEEFSELLNAVESWARESRRALETVHGDGRVAM